MNNLSWLIYLAEVLPSVASLVSFISYLLFFSFGVIIAIKALYKLGKTDSLHKNHFPDEYEEGMKINVLEGWQWVFVPIALSLVSVLIPSKETIYLIAGSEVGEVVVNSPEAKEIVDDIREVIKAQLEQLK